VAISDLLDKLGGGRDDDLDVPDDASELLDDEDGDELPDDPKPARKTSRAKIPGSQVKATPTERRQVKDALSLLIKGPAAAVSFKDPVCGGAAMQQADQVIKALVPIVCRNPTWLAWFTAANAPWLDILGLITALWPVASTVWGHHFARGRHEHGDDQAPGGGPVDLSAYAAPSF
jgi:hypothetical protein